MSFSDHLVDLDAALGEHVCDPARYLPGGDADQVIDPVHVMLERPTETDTLQDGQVVKTRPTIEVALAEVPALRRNDVFELAGNRWQVASAPTRTGDGRWWLADVQDLGPVA